jgi:nucleoside-diphosphate-sugar epimerase
MSTLVCLGLGYCARYHLAEFGSRFSRVIGTSRSTDPATNPRAEMLSFDGVSASQQLRSAIGDATHLLISAAPDEAGDPILRALGNDIAAAPDLQAIAYLSSLGVYGDHQGAWIDESAATIPAHTRGASRVDAELAWQALGRKRATPVAILRLAGIYGPGQNAFARLKAGRAHRIAKPGHVFNRVHVADIAQTIDAAFARNADGVFNVTDDLPAPPGDQITYAAALLGIEPPRELSWTEAEATLSPFILSFYSGCARVCNDKLKRELGVALRYPTYREGLTALHAAGDFSDRYAR